MEEEHPICIYFTAKTGDDGTAPRVVPAGFPVRSSAEKHAALFGLEVIRATHIIADWLGQTPFIGDRPILYSTDRRKGPRYAVPPDLAVVYLRDLVPCF